VWPHQQFFATPSVASARAPNAEAFVDIKVAMRRLALSSSCLALCLTLACADDGPVEGASDTATSGDGDGDANTEIGDGDGDPTGDGDGDPSGDGDGDGDGDPTGDGDGDPSGDGDGDPAGDGDGDGDGDPTGDGDGDPDALVRFIAIGDAGEGNAGQYNVAAAIEAVCADKGGCEFVLYLGDNFYDDGVASVDDGQFQTKFEMPYADLTMPFWIVMGNHDYGTLSFAWEKLAYEVEYTNYSDKWTMPAKWYAIDEYPNVDFFVMDTTRLMWNHETGAQQSWLDGAIAASNAPWKIAIAHHPYYSNGAHGNAGNYEGLPPLLSEVSGTVVKEVMDESLCGKVDLYLSGHDHNRQWPQGTCGGGLTTHFIVSGAGSKNTDFEHHGGGNEVYWEDDTKPGFLLLELTSSEIYTAFYDESGNLEFERSINK
jgi:tartrate-resistant acid phosphatase type 5